jgi:neutral ceramidase
VRRVAGAVWRWLALVLVLGCGPQEMPAVSPPAAARHPHVPGAIKVGAARADVTPPPGAGTFGHGPDGRVANGYWTRLYCRAFVFTVDEAAPTSSDGRNAPPQRAPAPLAIVPCDLGAISTLLQRNVAARVADLGITAPRLLITATHTHAGPAHYFDGTFYGGVMSSRLPGFDEEMLSFLADSIASAVRRAYTARTDAALGWVHSEVWGLTRNRSLEPYLANRPPYFVRAPDALHLPLDQGAIDPALNVLRIDAVAAGHPDEPLYPIGSLSFFAMHPTVLPNTNRLYGADVDGVVSRAIEREMRRASAKPGVDPLHGVVSTNEGDVSPIWGRGTVDEVEEIGAKLAEHVWSAYEDAHAHMHGRAVVDERYLEVDLPNAPILSAPGTALCNHAELGASAAGGATDHPTSLSAIDAFRPGKIDLVRKNVCERPRMELLGPLQKAMSSPYAFPRRVPVALAQIGDTLVSFLPAEITVTAGARINQAALMGQSGMEAATHAVIAGLANGYISYVTTPEEYQLQHYEGASDLYGPMTSELLKERIAELAGSLDGGQLDARLPKSPRLGEASRILYETGPRRDRFARADDEPELAAIAPARGPIGFCTLAHASTEPPAFCFWWGDGGPGRVSMRQAPWVALVRGDRARTPVTLCGAPLLSLPSPPGSCDPDAAIDDRGLDFETRVHDRFGDAWAWTTLFHPTQAEWDDLGKVESLRIRVIERSSAPSVESEAFSVAHMPVTCGVLAARYCGVE